MEKSSLKLNFWYFGGLIWTDTVMVWCSELLSRDWRSCNMMVDTIIVSEITNSTIQRMLSRENNLSSSTHVISFTHFYHILKTFLVSEVRMHQYQNDGSFCNFLFLTKEYYSRHVCSMSQSVASTRDLYLQQSSPTSLTLAKSSSSEPGEWKLVTKTLNLILSSGAVTKSAVKIENNLQRAQWSDEH